MGRRRSRSTGSTGDEQETTSSSSLGDKGGQRSYPLGAPFALPVATDGTTYTVAVSEGAILRVSSACKKGRTDNCDEARLLFGSCTEDGGSGEMLCLCRLDGRDGTPTCVAGLGIEVSGPRTVRFRAEAAPGNGINVFGSVAASASAPAPPAAFAGVVVTTVAAGEQVEAKAKRKAHGGGESSEPKGESEERAEKAPANKKAKHADDNAGADAATMPRGEEGSAPYPIPKPSAEGGDTPKLTKKQRKKLARQKARELEEAVAAEHGYATKKDKDGSDQKDQKKNQEATPKGKPLSLTRERRLDGGLLVRDVIIGDGHVIRPGRKVSVLYTGSFPDTGKVFDKNLNKNHPLEFRPGTGQVIRGLERGMEGMRVGGERVVTVPPSLGYGKKGSPPFVPGNATLAFEVKLVGVGGR